MGLPRRWRSSQRRVDGGGVGSVHGIALSALPPRKDGDRCRRWDCRVVRAGGLPSAPTKAHLEYT